jgi:transposase
MVGGGLAVGAREVFVMSVWPRAVREVPATTVEVARAAFPRGCFAMRLRDQLGELFADESFAKLFSQRGRPALAPGRLAMVSVMQFVEGLTDIQAADAVRGRLDWKYLLGLELRDQGFDASVLPEFRTRLAMTGAAEQLPAGSARVGGSAPTPLTS